MEDRAEADQFVDLEYEREQQEATEWVADGYPSSSSSQEDNRMDESEMLQEAIDIPARFETSIETTRLAPFNPTCSEAQEIALELLKLISDDVLFDLGCGDARFLLAAAERTPGLKCVGIELDPVHASRAIKSVKEAPIELSQRIEIRQGDVMHPLIQKPDGALSLERDATAVFLYLVPAGLAVVKPLLENILLRQRRGLAGVLANTSHPPRVVTYMFSLRGWEPSRVQLSERGNCPVYMYDGNSVRD